MQRVVFCPNESMYGEASKMASENQLPILMGRNERLSGIEFDDSMVAVINIPEDRYVIFPEELPLNIAGQFLYVNDFTDIGVGSVLHIKDPTGAVSEYLPSNEEKHLNRFVVRCGSEGHHSYELTTSSGETASGVFRVI